MAEGEAFDAVESLLRQWKLEEATTLLERQLAHSPAAARVYHDLSVLYAQQGFFDLALRSIEQAMERDPENRAVWHHYLALQKNNPEQPSDRAWKSMHLQYGDTLRERFDARHLSVDRPRDPGARLRVGYLSPDTHNATERFVWPMLQHFDRKAFEVVAYWNHRAGLPARTAEYPDVLHRSIEGLSTDQVVAAVLEERVDILVDVAGHGAGNALPALAQRPAPIQMTWLDYLATTGLETVDYRITDAVADPAGAEARHVETLIRLPEAQWCYRPPADAPPVTSGRAERGGPVVFGSVCVPLKLSQPLLEMWAHLLARVPGSRLRFLGIPEGRARARIASFFDRSGIAADRLDILGRLSRAQFLSALSSIDVVLDSYPFSGATSTLDALWQGVPVVTLAGRLSHSRSSASILAALGKPAWIAQTRDEYCEIAGRLASECRHRSFDSAGVRTGLGRSPLCDGPRFAGAMEDAYRRSWKEWLRSTESIDSARPRANARADVLLRQGSQADPARCRELLRTLPSHEATGQAFWSMFRAAQDAGAASSAPRVALPEIADLVVLGGEARSDERAMRGGARPWIAIASTRHYAPDSIEGTLPAGALAECDALASFGSDALPHGSPEAAGRGHVAGITGAANPDGTILARMWIPDGMAACAALAGPLLLVRRSVLEAHPFSRAEPAGEVDFFRSVTRYTVELHRRGARLGICAALGMPSPAAANAVERFRRERTLARELGLEELPQSGVAASPVQALLPAGAWPAFVRRAERFCDHPPT